MSEFLKRCVSIQYFKSKVDTGSLFASFALDFSKYSNCGSIFQLAEVHFGFLADENSTCKKLLECAVNSIGLMLKNLN